jgi:hypothetical protein
MLLHVLAKNEYAAYNDFASNEEGRLFLELTDEFLFYTGQIELFTRESPTPVIEKTRLVIVQQVCDIQRTLPGSWQESMVFEAVGKWNSWKCSFVTLAVQYDLVIYAMAATKSDSCKGRQGRPLLDFALRRRVSNPRPKIEQAPNMALVNLVLSLGADPNGQFEGLSVWSHFLRYLRRQKLRGPEANTAWLRATEALIKHGASRNPRRSPNHQTTIDAMQALGRLFDPDIARQFEYLFANTTSSRH